MQSATNTNGTTLHNQIQDAIDDIWSNTRITPYFDYLDNTTDSETASVLKHQVSAAIRYYEHFVKVAHTDKPLRLSKDCKYMKDESDPNNITKAAIDCTTTCGDTHC